MSKSAARSYESTGVNTFKVSYDGVVYQKDLEPRGGYNQDSDTAGGAKPVGLTSSRS
jgi:hypothetical protein